MVCVTFGFQTYNRLRPLDGECFKRIFASLAGAQLKDLGNPQTQVLHQPTGSRFEGLGPYVSLARGLLQIPRIFVDS